MLLIRCIQNKGQHIDYLDKKQNIIILYFSQAFVWLIAVTSTSVDILLSGLYKHVLTSSKGYNCNMFTDSFRLLK